MASNGPDFDVQAAHRYYSALCFNRAWDLIEKPDRTPDEDEEMICLSHAAMWHWMQRTDCMPKNVSIGYWQVSRIYAILGQVDNARRYGQLCLEASRVEGVPPFYLAYAYEALARSESLAGNRDQAEEYIAQARLLADKIIKTEDRQQLLDDLATIGG